MADEFSYAVNQTPNATKDSVLKPPGLLCGNFDTTVVMLSTGRTGTTAIAEYFDSAYPQVKALHEPKPSRRLRLDSNRFICGKLSEKEMARRLFKGRHRLLSNISEPIYIESNPVLSGFLDVLDQVFSHVKVVHVVRDPRNCILSSIHFRSGNVPKWIFDRLVPYWNIRPEQHNDAPTKSRSQMSEIEWQAWSWTMRNAFLNRGKSLYGENYLCIRFEDLFDAQGSGFHLLANWLGFPHEPKLVHAMKQKKVNASKPGNSNHGRTGLKKISLKL